MSEGAQRNLSGRFTHIQANKGGDNTIKATDLIDKFKYALENGWGYIYGTSGQRWTQARQDAATRPQTISYGQQWVGHIVADCSGLLVWAFKQLGESIYHGSNTIWKSYCSKQGKLQNGQRCDGIALRPGTAVFLLDDSGRHHIGLYIGDNTCIEAKGTKWGVTTSKPDHWDEWGELSQVDYSMYPEEVIPVTKPILKRGDRGDEVRELQNLLVAHGYPLTVDGVFGAKTETAVKNFQSISGLKPDGICGALTWAALQGETPEKPNDTDTICVSRDDVLAVINHIDAMRQQLDGLAYIARGWID